MAITVGSLTLKDLQELPFTHSGDSLSGQTARRFPVKAIVSPSDWLVLDGIYATWRAARLAEPDTSVSLSIGTTVNTTGRVWGMSWTNVPAWFSTPPVPAPAGAMVSVSFELVDAQQWLAVYLRSQAASIEVSDNESTYGTYSLAGLTLQLTAEADTYDGGPTVELAATTTHVIRGPLLATKVRKITGWTHAPDADSTIRAWYEAQIAALPAVGAWWPVTPPAIEQKPVIVSGARVTRYVISIELRQIR